MSRQTGYAPGGHEDHFGLKNNCSRTTADSVQRCILGSLLRVTVSNCSITSASPSYETEVVAGAGDATGFGAVCVWKASNEAGYCSIAATVIATLQSLLKDIPELHTWTLDDDTPVANPETQRWLEER